MKNVEKLIEDLKLRFTGLYEFVQETERQELYTDRNLAVLLALKEFQENGGEVGWKEADDTDSDWVIVWAKLPEGQVGWHIPRQDLNCMGWLEKKHIEYDGHTTVDKFQRLINYLEEEIELEEVLSDGN